VVEVVQVSVYENLLEFQSISPETPEIDHAFLEAGANRAKAVGARDLEKRGCDGNISYATDTRQQFIIRDVQIFPVVVGSGRNGIGMSVVNSFTTSNGVTVSAGLN
jgi:hypothetical protein